MRISVCLASYNGEKFLKEQLDSILLQLSSLDEVIISDDGSTDETIDLIKAYNDDRIRLLKNRHEKGPKGNFETAIEAAEGEYIFLSDQDDIWFDNKVSIVLSYLDSFDLVIHDALIIDSEGKSLDKNYFSFFGNYCSFWLNLYKTRFLGCCMAFRKSSLKYILPFPPNVEMHDFWIGMIIKVKGSIYFINEPLIKYRRHGNNFSSSSQKSKRKFKHKLKKRINCLWDVIIRCK